MEFHQFAALLYQELSTDCEEERHYVESARIAYPTYEKFDMPLPCGLAFDFQREYIRLPFDGMLVHLRQTEPRPADIFAFLSEANPGMGVVPDGAIFACVFCVAREGTFIRMMGLDADNIYNADMSDDHKQLQLFANAIYCFLCTVNHPDQRIQTHMPSPKLNRKRAAAGKQPLVIYKTLTILKPRTITVCESEPTKHHVSPRIHTRRGHNRKIHDKLVRVRPCLVGDKAQGLMLKDYKVVTPNETDAVH